MNYDQRTADLLRKAFSLHEGQIERLYRFAPEEISNPDLIPKLEYLTENHPPIDWSDKDVLSLICRGFFMMSYNHPLLCASVPERMGFTEKEREKYNAQILDWGRTEDPRPLKPLLAQLCDGELAEKIVRELCFPAARVGCDSIRSVCERLLSYPVRVSPEWFGSHWFLLFSVYADPCRILDELDKRFRQEHVMEVFMSDDEWSRIGYAVNGGLIGEMKLNPHYADERLEEAEKKFAAYRL